MPPAQEVLGWRAGGKAGTEGGEGAAWAEGGERRRGAQERRERGLRGGWRSCPPAYQDPKRGLTHLWSPRAGAANFQDLASESLTPGSRAPRVGGPAD